MKPRRLRASLAALAAAAGATVLALTGCSVQVAGPTDPAETGKITVVASTDVWGSVAQAIGGDVVDVTSIIDDPAKDPHDYQADARNQLAVSRANIVVTNGGGYDDFVGTMVEAAKQRPVVITAATISGHDQSASGFNEHLWYDFPTVAKVADDLADAFATASPAHRAAFEANAKAFDAQLATLESRESALEAQYAGDEITITEPVPLYLLDAIGLKNVTPEKFSAAVEADTDVAPHVLKDTLALYAKGTPVKLLTYNEQTAGAQTALVLAAAKKAGVAVVGVTETLPAHRDYVQWMTANLDAIEGALGD